MMKILIACECSGIVRDAFIAKGHDAVSCDLLPTDRPGPHIQGDVLPLLKQYWDMILAFPTCTYLTYAGTRHWNNPGRAEKREAAVEFFMKCYDANAEKVCVENPVGYMNTIFRKPDQIVHPYFFGTPVQKRTCLWLRNLLPLEYDKTIIEKPKPLYICQGKKCKGKAINWVEGIRGVKNRSKARSETFPCIANAMAEQWG